MVLAWRSMPCQMVPLSQAHILRLALCHQVGQCFGSVLDNVVVSGIVPSPCGGWVNPLTRQRHHPISLEPHPRRVPWVVGQPTTHQNPNAYPLRTAVTLLCV